MEFHYHFMIYFPVIELAKSNRHQPIVELLSYSNQKLIH